MGRKLLHFQEIVSYVDKNIVMLTQFYLKTNFLPTLLTCEPVTDYMQCKLSFAVLNKCINLYKQRHPQTPVNNLTALFNSYMNADFYNHKNI